MHDETSRAGASGQPPISWAAIPLFEGLSHTERESLRPFVRMNSYDGGATTLLPVRRQEFFNLISANPALARGLLLGLTRRLHEMTRQLSLRSTRVEYRSARLFLTLAGRLGRTEDGRTSVPMTLSRQEIADLVGTARETAIRIMSRWRKAGVLATEADGFRILDRAALEAIPPEE